jgi:hypothetical protein
VAMATLRVAVENGDSSSSHSRGKRAQGLATLRVACEKSRFATSRGRVSSENRLKRFSGGVTNRDAGLQMAFGKWERLRVPCKNRTAILMGKDLFFTRAGDAFHKNAQCRCDDVLE